MIRLLAVVEATTVTGPAKNLLEFCRTSQSPKDGGEGVEVSLVTFHRAGPVPLAPGESENEFVAAARALGVHVSVLPERKRFDPQVVELLREVARDRNPHIVQTHHVKSHCVMRLSGLWKSRPWVAWHHAYTITDFKMRCMNQVDRWSLRAARLVMTVNRPFVQDMQRIGVRKDRIKMLHNAARIGWNDHVTAAQIQETREKFGLRPEEQVVLAVGRFSKEKAHRDLLHAFAKLKARQPGLPLRLMLVGEGPERRNLEAAASALDIEKELIFAGQVKDVGPYFGLARVMALPSWGEGSPNVLLEAISAGLPIVSTTVGGIPEMVVDGESALLLEPKDIEAMARGLERVLTEKGLADKLAINGKKVAVRYSPENRLAALLQIYRELAPPSASRVG